MSAEHATPRSDVAEQIFRVEDLCDRYEAVRRAGDDRTARAFLRDEGHDPATAPARLLRALDEVEAAYRGKVRSDPERGVPAAGGPFPLPGAPAIPDYVIVGELGRGGMGVVYRAEDPALEREVAVKVLKPELAASPAALARFLREGRAAAAIAHDHVVPIYRVGDVNGTPYMVMPVLAGESLEARLTRVGILPPAEVARIGREAALGLSAAHARGLVHRDVKPANLWLESPTYRVKVLDFGLARVPDAADRLTQTGAVFGTPAYMAPEQANGEQVDGRADLFGLGAVLYRAATGKPAFEGKTLTAILRAVAEHSPPPPHEVNPSVPAALSDLIMRLLAKNPTDRPASARAVAEELAEFARTQVEGASGSVAGQSLSPQSPARRSRRWTRWGFALLVSFLVVAGVASLLNRPREPGDGLKAESPDPATPGASGSAPAPVRYRGTIDVLVEREIEPNQWKLLRLDDPRALPLRQGDRFRIEGTIDPPAYLYVVWVDPARDGKPDVTPVYPWSPEPKKGWDSRPKDERPTGKVSLPGSGVYTAPKARPGVATIVLLASPTPLALPDAEVRKRFEQLPDLPLPPGGERGVIWFDDYQEVTTAGRKRTFEIAEARDPFARWQGQLRAALGDNVTFQTSISFARTGNK